MQTRVVYQAPKPTKTATEIDEFIKKRILFPPLLAWDVAKTVMNFLLGWAVGIAVLPAQLKRAKGKAGNVCVTTYDGVELDTHEIYPDGLKSLRNPSKNLPTDQVCIIQFCGNNMLYQDHMPLLQERASTHNAIVVAFNYRGVNHSLGMPFSKEDLIIDGIAQVQRMLDRKIRPENIILDGYSLGGGIASYVAKYFHERGLPVRFFCDRAPTSLTDVVVGHIRLKKSTNAYEESNWGKFFAFILKPVISVIIRLFKWEINTEANWDAIPAHSKELVSIYDDKGKPGISKPAELGDTIITWHASLGRKRNDALTTKLAMGSKELSPKKVQDLAATMDRGLMNTKGSSNAHCLSLDSLYPYKDEASESKYSDSKEEKVPKRTAATFFNQFVQKTQASASSYSRKVSKA